MELFSRFNINYEQSAAPKSDLYRDLLPLLNSNRVALLDHPRLIAQLCGLERRTARGGRDSIARAAILDSLNYHILDLSFPMTTRNASRRLSVFGLRLNITSICRSGVYPAVGA
ncbi:MAG: hypothetical protein ABSE67_02890 [Xanthobacteraceae bacterium]